MHTSSTIMMSEPIAVCTSIERSGDSMCMLLVGVAAKRAPFSLMVRSPGSEKIW